MYVCMYVFIYIYINTYIYITNTFILTYHTYIHIFCGTQIKYSKILSSNSYAVKLQIVLLN